MKGLTGLATQNTQLSQRLFAVKEEGAHLARSIFNLVSHCWEKLDVQVIAGGITHDSD